VTAYWLERAWLGAGPVVDGVRVEVADGRLSSVVSGVAPEGAQRLAGLTIPGLANCHSHAFHRALRGRTQQGRGTFWTWRDRMYDVAATLTPDSCYDLAVATYREMALAGITTVGEFHYLHHGPGGHRYDDPNAMGHALVQAARDAGIRITLLDTCYLAAGIGRPPAGVQVRFSDGDAAAWRTRVERLAAETSGDVVVGAALHSVRAVPRDQIATVRDWAAGNDAPLHLHLSEQVAENDACQAAYGRTPTEVFADAEVLGPRTTAVHATHLGDGDISLLGKSATYACACPTTERDLGDGIGPAGRLTAAGSPLTLGSDSHAVIDLFEEMRAVEMGERLATRQRGHWTPEALLAAATYNGHRSLGYADAGRIQPGARADLVTLDTTTPVTAGTGRGRSTAVFAATAGDVVQVMVDGAVVATSEDRGRVGAELDRVVAAVWKEG
jgi:formiminoglutamate deiminase